MTVEYLSQRNTCLVFSASGPTGTDADAYGLSGLSSWVAMITPPATIATTPMIAMIGAPARSDLCLDPVAARNDSFDAEVP